LFVLSHPHWDVIPKWWMKAAWAERLTKADLGFRAFGLCPRVPSKPKLFGTFKASEVSQTPVKVASVSISAHIALA
jgi:hypothetical protein